LAQVFLLAFVSICAFFCRLLDHTVASHPPQSLRISLLSYTTLILALASALHSAHPAIALQEIALGVGLIGLAYAIRSAVRTSSLKPLVTVLVLGQLSYFFVTGSVFIAALMNGQPLNARSLHIGYDNPRFFNHVQTLAIPLLIGFSFSAPRRSVRLAAGLVTSINFAWLFFDLARASLLGIGFSIAWLWYCHAEKQIWRLLACAGAGVAIWALILVGLPFAVGATWTTHFASVQELTSSHSRDQLIKAALELARQHPWLGTGPMHFATLDHPKGSHPHNLYLQWAAELGWPAMALILALLLRPIWRAASHLRAGELSPNSMAVACGAALVAALVDAGFSGNFVMPISQVWIAVTFGLLLASIDTAKGPDLTRPGSFSVPRGYVPISMGLLLLTSQLWLCHVSVKQWRYDPPRMDESVPIPVSGEKQKPRFWLHGRF